jgi:hypothetical protein
MRAGVRARELLPPPPGILEDDAKERVRELSEIRQGHYVIDDEDTRERVFINTRDERKN